MSTKVVTNEALGLNIKVSCKQIKYDEEFHNFDEWYQVSKDLMKKDITNADDLLQDSSFFAQTMNKITTSIKEQTHIP